MDLDRFAIQFSALAHPLRLGIVVALSSAEDSDMPAGLIAEQVGIAPSNASHHLSVLERAGIIIRKRAGSEIRYSLKVGIASELQANLVQLANGR